MIYHATRKTPLNLTLQVASLNLPSYFMKVAVLLFSRRENLTKLSCAGRHRQACTMYVCSQMVFNWFPIGSQLVPNWFSIGSQGRENNMSVNRSIASLCRSVMLVLMRWNGPSRLYRAACLVVADDTLYLHVLPLDHARARCYCCSDDGPVLLSG